MKEYRAAEALQVILADRDRESVVCPSCGGVEFERTPKRRIRGAAGEAPYRQVTLKCQKCGRQASYIPGQVTQPSDSQLAANVEG
ncbi:MAG: hypothetical protein WD934_11685 [Gemmatimonadales bacterium]